MAQWVCPHLNAQEAARLSRPPEFHGVEDEIEDGGDEEEKAA